MYMFVKTVTCEIKWTKFNVMRRYSCSCSCTLHFLCYGILSPSHFLNGETVSILCLCFESVPWYATFVCLYCSVILNCALHVQHCLLASHHLRCPQEICWGDDSCWPLKVITALQEDLGWGLWYANQTVQVLIDLLVHRTVATMVYVNTLYIRRTCTSGKSNVIV